MPCSTQQIIIGGIPIDVMSRKQWASRIVSYCRIPRTNGSKPKVVFYANGQVVTHHAVNPSFRRLFQKADAVAADGQPLVWASKMTRSALPERAATTDLVHDVAVAAQAEGLSFFLLGASEWSNSVADAALRATYPGLRVVGRRSGYFAVDAEPQLAAEINALRPDVLWVGMGMMRQTEFAIRNQAQLGQVGCIVTCGGLFDHFTNEVKRAPAWMQEHSLEWLFRTWQQPRKYFWRYLFTNPVAVWLLLTRTRSSARLPQEQA